MSDNTKDGGPAFPHPNPGYSQDRRDFGGMSMRDWMVGQILASSAGDVPPSAFDEYAKAAYKLADAVLRARIGETSR